MAHLFVKLNLARSLVKRKREENSDGIRSGSMHVSYIVSLQGIVNQFFHQPSSNLHCLSPPPLADPVRFKPGSSQIVVPTSGVTLPGPIRVWHQSSVSSSFLRRTVSNNKERNDEAVVNFLMELQFSVTSVEHQNFKILTCDVN